MKSERDRRMRPLAVPPETQSPRPAVLAVVTRPLSADVARVAARTLVRRR